MATKIEGDTIPVPGPYINMTLREPLGVIGGIIPWNYPLLQAIWKIAPAIAAGNTVGAQAGGAGMPVGDVYRQALPRGRHSAGRRQHRARLRRGRGRWRWSITTWSPR